MTELEKVFKKYKDKEITLEEYNILSKEIIQENNNKSKNCYHSYIPRAYWTYWKIKW